MRTVQPSHYQPIKASKHPPLNIDNMLPLEELLFELGLGKHDGLPETKYLVDGKDRQLDTWGIVEFSDSLYLFPTGHSDDMGAIVSYMGKTLYVWFDEDFKLTIGVNGRIYCFENTSFIEDFHDLYHMVFLGINPQEDSPQPY